MYVVAAAALGSRNTGSVYGQGEGAQLDPNPHGVVCLAANAQQLSFYAFEKAPTGCGAFAFAAAFG